MSMPSVLEKIIKSKRADVESLKREISIDALKEKVGGAPPVRDFIGALSRTPGTAVIAEIKKASPSAGRLKDHVDVAGTAVSYELGGAAALSVLTDGPFFGGRPSDLTEARASVELPVLRKDFIIDPVQVYEARMIGADAVLLIAAALEPGELSDLYGLIIDNGMTPLVEVHNEQELKPVLDLNPLLIGVNNRDLSSLKVDIETSIRLRKLIPDGVFTVCESGVSKPSQIARLRKAGLNAFLIGTAFMKAENPRAAVAELCAAGA